MKNIIVVPIVLALIALSFVLGRISMPKNMGAIYSGQIGVFNASAITLSDGTGASVALDAYGRAVISNSTTLNVTTP